MNVKSILDDKGHDVVTVGPDEKLAEAARMLSERGIGALVITRSGGRVAGILSERDIVACIAKMGAQALEQPVTAAMTAKVSVCQEHNTINEVMQIMTRGRFRHLPVVKDGALDGIVSIGDVVKRRIEEVEQEAEAIRTYIATA
jgi:CBS domain-containing protein